jgi:hypothetical protein
MSSYIAKAMDKTRRLDAAADRVERARSDASDDPETSSEGPELVILPGAGVSKSSEVLPPMRRPVLAKGEDSLPSGSLESAEEPEDLGPAARPWWKERLVWTGVALGLSAILLGFLFAPVGPPELEAPPAASSAVSAIVPREADAAPSESDDVPVAVSRSRGGNPVVVRVEIDSGSGEVRLEGAGAIPNPPVSAEPTPPPVFYDPLPPLELPPPPFYDASDAAPRSSSTPSFIEPTGASIDDYVLEGIFWTEDNPAAIINDEIVEAGKRVGLLRVVSVERTHVVVELKGRTYDLR